MYFEFFAGGVWAPTVFVLQNLRSKIFWNFFIYIALWTEFFRGGLGQFFFGHAKFEVKNFLEYFHLQNTLDSEFVRRGPRHQLYWLNQI